MGNGASGLALGGQATLPPHALYEVRVYPYTICVRRVEVKDGKFSLSDEVERVYEERVTKFSHGAKIGCSRKYLGRRVYVMVLKEE